MEINTNPHDASNLELVDPEAAKEFQRRRELRQQEEAKAKGILAL